MIWVIITGLAIFILVGIAIANHKPTLDDDIRVLKEMEGDLDDIKKYIGFD